MTQIALIIGGTQRVGRWCSEALLRKAYRVHAVYRNDTALAQQFITDARSHGWDLHVHQADATREEDLAQLVETVWAPRELIDVLVVAGGPSTAGALGELSAAEAERVWAGNVLAVHNSIRAALKRLRAPGGRIIAFLSAGSDTPRAFHQVPWYAACKLMLGGYLRSLARELAPQGITVNAISLGVTELPPEGAPAVPLSSLPTGKYLDAEDIGSALINLCSVESSQLTGSVVQLGGGFGL